MMVAHHPVGCKNSIGAARQPVCGELLVKRRQGDSIGLGSDSASGKNADLQPLIASSGLLRSVFHYPTHNGSADDCGIL